MAEYTVREHLAGVLDAFTIRRLADAGVPESARCLQIGAGTGRVARWLADRTAEVIATDHDPSAIPPYPGVTVLVHDLATDPLIDSRFDLIHVRLAMAHLPCWRRALRKLVAALAPGGVLVIEEFEAAWDRCVVETPDPAAHRLFEAYQAAFEAVLERAGTDPHWWRRAQPAMREAGMVGVESEFWARSWHGGQPGCLLAFTAAGQLRDQLVTAGMTAEDVDYLRALLLDSRLVIRGNLAVSTLGRKPATWRQSA